MATAINVKNLYGVETRDNKGTELTWGEMDSNLKILTISDYISYDFDPQAVKQLTPLLLAIQDTDFNTYSNEEIIGELPIQELPIQELCTLSIRAKELGDQAFLDLDKNQNIYFVIPFTYYEVGEGLDGISPYMLKQQSPTDYTKDISWDFYKYDDLININYDGFTNNEYYQYDLYASDYDIQTGDKIFAIAHVYLD